MTTVTLMINILYSSKQAKPGSRASGLTEMSASSLLRSFSQYMQHLTHPRTETASLITSKHGNQSLSEAFTPRHLQSSGIGQGFNKGNSCRVRIWWITFTHCSQKGLLQTHYVTNHLALQRWCDEWGRKQQRAGGPGKRGSCSVWRASTTGFWTVAFHSQSHTLCIIEGPTDAQVLFNGLCQRCCFDRFLAP